MFNHGPSKKRRANEYGKKRKVTCETPLPRLCCVCANQNPSYKFKCCGKQFCQVKCYKEHTVAGCDKVPLNQNAEEKDRNVAVKESKNHVATAETSNKKEPLQDVNNCESDKDDVSHEPAETDDDAPLTETQRASLRNNQRLKEYLSSASMQKAIRDALVSGEYISKLSILFQDSYFNSFVDEVMETINFE